MGDHVYDDAPLCSVISCRCMGLLLYVLSQFDKSEIKLNGIVRPANRDWACQTERCNALSNKTIVYSKSGVIAYVRFTRATN